MSIEVGINMEFIRCEDKPFAAGRARSEPGLPIRGANGAQRAGAVEKDIAIKLAEAERGKATGTPVGCACGDGVIDWASVIAILRASGFSGVMSVECGTPVQAARSLTHLRSLIASTEEKNHARKN